MPDVARHRGPARRWRSVLRRCRCRLLLVVSAVYPRLRWRRAVRVFRPDLQALKARPAIALPVAVRLDRTGLPAAGCWADSAARRVLAGRRVYSAVSVW